MNVNEKSHCRLELLASSLMWPCSSMLIGPAAPPLGLFERGCAHHVVGAFRSFKFGTAYGRDGLRVRHLLDILGPPAHGLGSLVLEGLTSLLDAVFRGAMPVGIRPFWVGGPVTPLLKPQGGIRPMAVGSIFRRLASKIAVRAALPVVGPYSNLRLLQVGVGVRGGGEALVHSFNREHVNMIILLCCSWISKTHSMLLLGFEYSWHKLGPYPPIFCHMFFRAMGVALISLLGITWFWQNGASIKGTC
eukprot:jgi/Botrbrau1/10996/Bobra.0234s0019.1